MGNAFLRANWENLIMANYEIEPSALAPYLPKGVELDYYNNKTYVSLVGFMFKNTRLFGVPIPFFGSFEEINLRFYVKKVENRKIKKGVVFINETVPFKIVALLANKLYKEHYTVVPTRHSITNDLDSKKVKFEWKLNDSWNSIYVEASNKSHNMKTETLEKFIYEHYFGYTKIDENNTEEYRLQHPSWKINSVIETKIGCDFEAMYGKAFSVLNTTKPEAVFIAEGSSVKIEWKRNRLKFDK